MQGLRVGHGYDVHRLVENRALILGGVRIEYSKGLDGHSDADVVLHAITDSVLGAASLPDIGTLFPNTDISYKDANSADLLSTAWNEVRQRGWMLGNLDVVILAEKPLLKPYMTQMKLRIADILGVVSDQVGIKATTGERLGFIGREEGIAASAVCLLIKCSGQ